MRIIAGKYRSRKLFISLDKAIRPTKDRVKEALFSSLDSHISLKDANFLDAFAGSGAVGLEALSRGAKSVTFMDINTKLVKENIDNLFTKNTINETDKISVISCNLLNPPKGNNIMDVVFIDPPYKEKLGYKTIQSLIKSNWADEKTLFIIEADDKDDSIKEGNFSFFKEKKYGKSIVYFLKI